MSSALRFVQDALAAEHTAAVRGYEVGKNEFRNGLHGSTVPDMLRIMELEQRVAFQQSLIESCQLAYERMAWLTDQDSR